MKNPFDGTVAVVTGGASGIGAALGTELAARGARVVLADRQSELAQEVAKKIEQRGGTAVGEALDVRELAAQQALVKRTSDRWGRIDYYFNNAGIGVGGEMSKYEARDWDDVFDVNLRGVAYGIQAVYPVFRAQRSGHIVNTASMAGLVTSAGAGSYAATKHAVVGLSKALRLEAQAHGVRVSVLCPGVIDTPILSGGAFGRMEHLKISRTIARGLWDRTRPMDTETFAKQSLDAVARNEAIIVVPRWWKALWYLERVSPALSFAFWRRALHDMRQDLAKHGVDPLG